MTRRILPPIARQARSFAYNGQRRLWTAKGKKNAPPRIAPDKPAVTISQELYWQIRRLAEQNGISIQAQADVLIEIALERST